MLGYLFPSLICPLFKPCPLYPDYPLLDLQQLSTGLATLPSVACSVISTVISSYDLRSEKMCDAGCIAMSKDVGPEKGLGRVLNLDETTTGWRLGRVSQEHGLLVKNDKEGEAKALEIGQKIRIVPVSRVSRRGRLELSELETDASLPRSLFSNMPVSPSLPIPSTTLLTHLREMQTPLLMFGFRGRGGKRK